MIKKPFEISSLNKNLNFLLFYGKNEGAKKEEIEKIRINNKDKEVSIYDEKQILENSDNFFNKILSKSLFNTEKVILINRATDKLTKYIEQLILKDTSDIIIIINAEILEKRSKLRLLFEKEKKLICIAFYPDTPEILSRITQNLLRQMKLTISQANINLIINRSNGDRDVLKNELKKIEIFSKGNKKITTENILKLTNLIENYSITELIDNCLVQNKKKTIHILNENNFTNEDCIIITRTFINKLKKILKLSFEYQKNKDLGKTISNAKPPIFWKDKEITKHQIIKWKPRQINELIFELNKIELQIKKNYINPINLISDFLLDKSSNVINNNP